MQKHRIAIIVLLGAATAFLAAPSLAQAPDGVTVPPGFHATVVADGLGPIRHLAVRDNGDIYVSTGRGKLAAGSGIIALHQDASHKADRTEHFGAAAGTGIRIQNGALYAADANKVYRYDFRGDELVPTAPATLVVDNIPDSRAANHAIALDGKGNLYVSVDGMANLCTAPGASTNTPPVGLKPCPDLGVRAGIWRFSATAPNQDFAKGELVATGIRDLNAMDIAPDGTIYGFMHGRDTTSRQFPTLVSDADEANIADELHVVVKGADFGWPYTYYDGVRKVRLVAPEYGGDGKTPATGNYAPPLFTLQGKRAAPLDMLFYQGRDFPAQYRGGLFVVLHGTGGETIQGGKTGDDIIFLPRGADGKFGAPSVFAAGFAGTPQPDANGRVTPQYRVTGAAVGPDGALYVADGSKGRIWRIAYGAN
jgi:glucose/arabinose dehydrogenase